MNKLYILTGIIALQSMLLINTAENKGQQTTRQTLYKLTLEDPKYWNWDAIFTAIDNAQNPVDVNSFIIPHLKATLLEAAVMTNNLAVTEVLLEKYGADPNAISSDTELTAMILACLSENRSLISLLLQYGGNPYSIHQRTGKNCFELCNDNPRILRLLNTYKIK